MLHSSHSSVILKTYEYASYLCKHIDFNDQAFQCIDELNYYYYIKIVLSIKIQNN